MLLADQDGKGLGWRTDILKIEKEKEKAFDFLMEELEHDNQGGFFCVRSFFSSKFPNLSLIRVSKENYIGTCLGCGTYDAYSVGIRGMKLDLIPLDLDPLRQLGFSLSEKPSIYVRVRNTKYTCLAGILKMSLYFFNLKTNGFKEIISLRQQRGKYLLHQCSRTKSVCHKIGYF